MTQDNISLAIAELEGLLGNRLSTGTSIREIHGRDEAHTQPALPDAVVFPENTQEVSAIMKICSARTTHRLMALGRRTKMLRALSRAWSAAAAWTEPTA